MRYLTFIILLFTLLSCSKHTSEIKEFELSGDYEWFYSYTQPFDSHSSEEVVDKYGIRIKESGSVVFYKNGAKISNHRISFIEETIDYVEIVYRIDKFQDGSLYYRDGKIVMANWPFSSFQNEFLKVNK